MKSILLLLCATLLLSNGRPKQKADLIIFNARIYTVDERFSIAEAMVIKDGKILETGTYPSLLKRYDANEKFDARQKFIYPGLIDAHAHFVGYASSLQRINLVGTSSWEQVIRKTQEFATINKEGWLLGRGWDQNDWISKQYPDNTQLTALFPNRPVMLTRIDGHAAIANKKALEAAGIKAGDKIEGGDIEVKNGQLTGILIDNAVDLVTAKIPAANPRQFRKALLAAQQNCFAVGLTTIDDCGLDHTDITFIDSLQKNGELKMRIYAMLSDARQNFDFALARGKIKTERLNVRSFKVYADGALGSRGACLLHPYTDKPGWSGFLLSSQAHFDSVANLLAQRDFQMCTHAIGDSGNRTILSIYANYLQPNNDRRWRIEHAQVINPADFSLFGKFNIIPSVQPTHATSDMYWAGDRLGKEREKGAYAWKQLLEQNQWLPLGTDFPVEDISPFKTFYAAVARKDAKGWPASGYQMQNALTREQALRGMTIWAARSNFEEKEKGSLEAGKFADFIILDQDLMQTGEKDLLQIKVLNTFVDGKIVYGRKK